MENPDTKKNKRSRQGGNQQRDNSRDINKPEQPSRDVQKGDQGYGDQRDDQR